ncbi:MAG: bifunctional N(6)-L-threonylcarbamoyladenine synthase/serine/threonine protein kinase [Candidatus Heimdallarchaeota archaeon]|nr:MAG: bifunctional N(6)-L-threonylcarbamoyladenine synthase/serine/threonine protein kinase [Candidatus Heimdallarchaeota archaeon]
MDTRNSPPNFKSKFIDSDMVTNEPIILGFEGTAHTAGIAIVKGKNIIINKSATYLPTQGGIHPREASEFLSKHFPKLLEQIFHELPFDTQRIDAIAFSQGPGLGPCLRITATIARAISLLIKRPLIGVNHCIAHVELGRMVTPAQDPLVLYVSGGNTQLITYLNGRYRILGETLDVAIGNALDSLGRKIGLPHPGGVHIEQKAKSGQQLLHLPYAIKGMSFSFSGVVTAAYKLISEYSVSDICFSFQEYTYAALAEATERALSCTKKSSLLLTGGVAANMRLQEMMQGVASEQSVKFFVVPKDLAGDNGAMIALAGVNMYKANDFIDVKNSQVIPRWRTDQVEVSWIH